MKAFFQALGRFFRSLFGGSHNEETESPSPPVIPTESNEDPPIDTTPEDSPSAGNPPTPVSPPVSTTVEDRPQDTGSTASFLVLERDAAEGAEISGKLYLNGDFCCFTLEAAGKHVPAGSHPLSLRTKGGLHATYGYKYGEMHKGVLQLESDGEDFIFIRSGNNAQDGNGGIVVGNSIENGDSGKEVWNSDEAYKKLYPSVAEKLVAGEAISLEIKA